MVPGINRSFSERKLAACLRESPPPPPPPKKKKKRERKKEKKKKKTRQRKEKQTLLELMPCPCKPSLDETFHLLLKLFCNQDDHGRSV